HVGRDPLLVAALLTLVETTGLQELAVGLCSAGHRVFWETARDRLPDPLRTPGSAIPAPPAPARAVPDASGAAPARLGLRSGWLSPRRRHDACGGWAGRDRGNAPPADSAARDAARAAGGTPRPGR